MWEEKQPPIPRFTLRFPLNVERKRKDVRFIHR